MKVKMYNKLVRDRIREIIESSGKACMTEILTDEAYLRMLDKKQDEELAEYHRNQNVEELICSSRTAWCIWAGMCTAGRCAKCRFSPTQ